MMERDRIAHLQRGTLISLRETETIRITAKKPRKGR